MRRRDFIQHCSVCAAGTWLLGCDTDPVLTDGGPNDSGPSPFDAGFDAGPACPDAFAGGTMMGVLPFVETAITLDRRGGSGLDGRLSTDLSRVETSDQVIENDVFYIRTMIPDLLVPADPWTIDVSGLATAANVTIDDVRALAEPQGHHVLECSGNGPGGGFGLLSAADWTGAPLRAVLDTLDIDPSATRVLVEGFDMHSRPSAGGHSTPGASWIFSFDEIDRFGAFLATEMNGVPLPDDHGAPVRLYVPGWYGCSCIKWVDRIRLVDDDEPATGQMLEFSGRTHQVGAPTLARDFRPAVMDQAAMPVRVEKWRTADGGLLYRVLGILWGGSEITDALRFDAPGSELQPVDVCPPMTTNQTWTVWQHAWRPDLTGEYQLNMVIDDPAIPTNRLDTRFYQRSVVVDEV